MKLKTFTSFVLFILFFTSLKAQTNEYFESATAAAKSFTSNSQAFTLTNKFLITNLAGAGVDNHTPANPGSTFSSNQFVDNYNQGAASQVNSIKTSNAALFTVKNLYYYVSSDIIGTNPTTSGSITFNGKVSGSTIFTKTISSGFNGAFTNYQGFNYLDFSSGTDYSNTSIDELEIVLGGAFIYVAIDNFTWASPAPVIATTGTLSAFTSCSGSVSAAQSFTVSGTSLTASITVTAPAGFEVSTSLGSGYGGNVNLSPSGGTISNTTIYARLTVSASGTPSGNVACSSTGATTKNVAVSGTVTATPSVSGTTPGSRCDAGTVTLGAIASAGTLNWYVASSGGSSLGTGTSFVTPSLTVTTTYYVDATNNSCTSARSAVIATVNTTPSVSGTTPASRCDAGTVTLGATASAGTLNWYAASSGGSSLGTGTSFVTPSLTVTTTYYVDATNNSCTSARSAVIATVNTTPSVSGTTPASRCDAGTVTLGATASAGTLNWYAASSGGSSLGTGTSFVTPSLTVTTTYYVDATNNSCTSARSAVIATVNTTPSVSGTTPASRCDAGTVTLGATASAGTLNWYAASSGGSSLGTGTSFITPSLTVTTTYYVDATNNSCTSARSAVVAMVNTTPSVSGTTPASRCDAGTVTLGATASAGTLNWYAASSGGSSLGTGTSFITPSLTVTTTYYVDATNNSCTSARSAVVAMVNTTPSVSGTTPGSRCDAGTVTLGATASAGTLNWYAASSGGSSLGTGISFVTPSLTVTTTYYVDATNNSCTSARSAVVATVNTTPSVSGTTPGSRCDAGTVTLGATASAGTLNWYAASSGGSSLGTGISFVTPSLTVTTTYYVDATNNSCTSARSAVVATVNTTPSVSGTTPGSRCDAGTVTLGATASAGTLNWYAASSGGSSLGTGISFVTPSLTVTTTYYVDATNNSCTSARSAVVATVNTTPSVSGTTPGSRCDAGTVTLGATASAGTLNWYAASSGGSSLGTGTSFITPSLTVTTTYYVDATNNSCTSNRMGIQATVNDLPLVIPNASSTTVCAGKMVTLTGGGATTYTWTGGVTDGIGFVPSATTTYTVTGTDANTCSNTATVTIDVNPEITNSMTVTSPICGNSDGTVSTAVSGGTSPFTYAWNNAETTATLTGLTGLPTQTLVVTITDAKGCTHRDTALVDCVLAVEENGGEISLNIYPNPTDGKFTVELNKGQLPAGNKYHLEIYNTLGEKVDFTSVKDNNLSSGERVELNAPDGIYFLKVLSDKQSYTQKIIISK